MRKEAIVRLSLMLPVSKTNSSNSDVNVRKQLLLRNTTKEQRNRRLPFDPASVKKEASRHIEQFSSTHEHIVDPAALVLE